MFEIILSTGIIIEASIAPKDIHKYRWVNVVTQDPYGMVNHKQEQLTIPYIDPPPGGFNYGVADNSPYYYDDNDCEKCEEDLKVNKYYDAEKGIFKFIDFPADPRLKKDESIIFKTCLVDTTITPILSDASFIKCVNWEYKNRRVNLIQE